jgi:hypothetical protein
MHIAAGLNFDDTLTVTERRPVLYFALESQTAIRKRLMAWKKYHDPMGDKYTDEMTFPFYTVEESINLLDEAARLNLVEQIKAADAWWLKKGEKHLGVIVIDTLTKAMPGGDQNSVEDTSAVFDVIAKIKTQAGQIHHDVLHYYRWGSGSAPCARSRSGGLAIGRWFGQHAPAFFFMGGDFSERYFYIFALLFERFTMLSQNREKARELSRRILRRLIHIH